MVFPRGPDMAPAIGLDFDNTIAIYDDVAAMIAVERGLISLDATVVHSGIKAIRDHIRTLTDGELQWQELQAELYGKRITEAYPAPGIRQFFETCARNDVEVVVVSHKTRFARRDVARVDLRESATNWMRENGLIESASHGISPENLYFENTRSEKVDRIRSLNCTHFVDDLPEVFASDTFPDGVDQILYAPHGTDEALAGVAVFRNWVDITRYLFPKEDGLG